MALPPAGTEVTALAWLGAVCWGATVAVLFLSSLRIHVRALVRGDGARSRRFVLPIRWLATGFALSLGALGGSTVVGTLFAFVVARNVYLRRELGRGT